MIERTDQLNGVAVPRIEQVEVVNYRALRNLQLRGIQPLTVFLGRNGSGKSTIFDVFAFLSECFTQGLRSAWDRRGRFKELRTRGQDGPIQFVLKYREKPKTPVITYSLSIDEDSRGPFVEAEWLQWKRAPRGRPFKFLEFRSGEGEVASGEQPDINDTRVTERLSSRELLAVNTLGQLRKHPRVSELRKFISGWYLSYLSADNSRGNPEAGPQERLTVTGNNLPNVIQYLKEQHPERLDKILQVLGSRVPHLEKIEAEIMQDGRLLLTIKDAPFEKPVLAKYASDGTLKMLAYLTVLYDPDPPQMIGLEEPENHLHPLVLPELAEECRVAANATQVLVTTHSPFFINGIRPEELWVLSRDTKGFTAAQKAIDIEGVKEFCDNGALLGDLWIERHLGRNG